MATAKLFEDGERWSVGKDGTASRRLLVFYNPATEDKPEIETAAVAAMPTIYGIYLLRKIEYNWYGYGMYEATGHYTQAEPTDPDDPPTGDPPEFSFEISSQQVKVFASLGVISQGQASGQTIPDNGNLIGVQPDGTIEGVEVPQMVYTFSESWYFATVSTAYKAALANLVGTVNFGATFRGYAAGTVLATGVSGSQQGDSLWKLRYQFGFIPNLVNATVGDITGINKAGWDYIEWFSDEENNQATKRIERKLRGYRVHRVLRTGDFTGFGIGTA